MTTEMIEFGIGLQVAVGDPEPVSVEDAARLVAEIRRLRADGERVRALCEHAISEGDYVDWDATELAKAILRGIDGEA